MSTLCFVFFSSRGRHTSCALVTGVQTCALPIYRDLTADVRAGQFRADLYHRLAVMKIEIPPLRDRSEDVAPLVGLFLGRAASGAPGGVRSEERSVGKECVSQCRSRGSREH